MITRKNRLWINEYLKCNNLSEATRRVYPKIRNANVYGSRLLSKVDIKEEIALQSKALVLDVDAIKKAITEISRNGKVESNKLRALELLAKIEGLYKDNNTNSIALFGGIVPNSRITNAIGKEA